MMKTFEIDYALKQQQWEIAKGHLMALAAMQGSYHGNVDKWKALLEAISAFIAQVEDEGLNE